MKHYVCRGCGNLVAMINDTGRRIGCCGENMHELTPNSVDASREKHQPTIAQAGDVVTVTVGEAGNMHPQLPEHAISWVCLITTGGSQRKLLTPDGKAEAKFYLAPGEKVVKAFAYCNLHGLWVTECKSDGSCDRAKRA